MRIGSYSYDNALHCSRRHCVEEFGEIATGFWAGLRKALRSTAGSPVVQPIRRESGSTSLLNLIRWMRLIGAGNLPIAQPAQTPLKCAD